MCCFYHTGNTINLVTATKYTAFGVIEHSIFVKDLVDCSAATHGVIFAKNVVQITKQQIRYAVGHRVLRLVFQKMKPARRSSLFCHSDPRSGEEPAFSRGLGSREGGVSADVNCRK